MGVIYGLKNVFLETLELCRFVMSHELRHKIIFYPSQMISDARVAFIYTSLINKWWLVVHKCVKAQCVLYHTEASQCKRARRLIPHYGPPQVYFGTNWPYIVFCFFVFLFYCFVLFVFGFFCFLLPLNAFETMDLFRNMSCSSHIFQRQLLSLAVHRLICKTFFSWTSFSPSHSSAHPSPLCLGYLRPSRLWRLSSTLLLCCLVSIRPAIRPLRLCRTFVHRPHISPSPGWASLVPKLNASIWCSEVSLAPTPWSCSTMPFSRCLWQMPPSSCSGESKTGMLLAGLVFLNINLHPASIPLMSHFILLNHHHSHGLPAVYQTLGKASSLRWISHTMFRGFPHHHLCNLLSSRSALCFFICNPTVIVCLLFTDPRQ